MFPIEKYKYFTNGADTVIAEQTFAGKKYRGKAVCKAGDEFDFEVGKAIAAAKCNLKICEARLKFASRKLKFAKDAAEFFNRQCSDAIDYVDRSEQDVYDAKKYFNEVMIANGVK